MSKTTQLLPTNATDNTMNYNGNIISFSASDTYSDETVVPYCACSITKPGWQSTNSVFPHWWQVDFGNRVKLSKVSFSPRDDVVSVLVKNYEILGSKDGNNFTLLKSGVYVPNNKVEAHVWQPEVIQIPLEIIRYLRINITDSYDNRGYKWTCFKNVLAYGKYIDNNRVYLSTTGVYGMSNGTFQQLAPDWNALSDEEKVALFTATNGETPTVDELKTIGKFKVITYSEDNEQPECVLTAIPKDLPPLETKESYIQKDAVSTQVSSDIGLRPVLCVPDPQDSVQVAPKCELTLKEKPTFTKPGEAFSFEYTVKEAGTLGIFAAPGKAIKPDLMDGPGTTPDGTAYFVNVGTEYNGAMKFVCDRNIQGGISWETLNTAGMCVTSGMDVSDFTGIKGSRMRLMESSVVNPSMDKRNSEWDEIIFQDNIPNTDVSASKINNWNYTKTRSWMLNTPSQDDVTGKPCDMGARVVRGCEDRYYTTVGTRFLPSDKTYDTVCLRPVLTIPTDKQSVLADSVVTPTRTLNQDITITTDYVYLNKEATLDNTTIEYMINNEPLYNGENQNNTLKPASQHLIETIPLDRLNFGKNNITLSIASAGVINKSEFTVYREKIGDTQRVRDFQDYTGGHNTSNLAIRKGSLVSSALTTKHENETEIKLPDNIISIKVED